MALLDRRTRRSASAAAFGGVSHPRHFLDHDHTISHFKEEIWIPELIDRTNREDWEKSGRKSMGHRVRDRVLQILETHETEPLEEKMVQELKGIIAKADEKYA